MEKFIKKLYVEILNNKLYLKQLDELKINERIVVKDHVNKLNK